MAKANRWNTIFCDVCQKDTLHYRESDDKPDTCCNHSKLVIGKKRAVATGYIKPPVVGPTEHQLRIANKLDMSMWRSAEDRQTRAYVSGPEWEGILEDAPVKPIDPDKAYCTFCGRQTEKIHLLSENKPKIRRVVEQYRDSAGQMIQKEKVITSVERVHACPNCSLNIRKGIVVRTV